MTDNALIKIVDSLIEKICSPIPYREQSLLYCAEIDRIIKQELKTIRDGPYPNIRTSTSQELWSEDIDAEDELETAERKHLIFYRIIITLGSEKRTLCFRTGGTW